jgi:putative tryptophan/tyrosine transport system substrate-binding protein
MRRREFIALAGGAAASWPLVVHAQQASKLPTVGLLGADQTVWSPWTAAFSTRLGELGWIEGRTVTIEYRWSQARPERNAQLAAELVSLKVNVIVTSGSAVPAAMKVTSTIPIVFALANDPVGGGIVTSLAKPGGNITGISLESTDLAGKRLELLRAVIPELHRFAVMYDAGYPQTLFEVGEIRTAAQALGFEMLPMEIHRAEEVAGAFESLPVKVDALYVIQNALIGANRTRILTFALGKRLPTMFNSREFAEAGALLSYGPSYPALFRRAADLTDKILRGSNPGEIPVEQPTRFELVVNLVTAKVLGINVPSTLLARADEVIE